MNPSEYQKLAERTECNQASAATRMFDIQPIRLNHSVIGLAGEVGELASRIQKWIYYGKPLDEAALTNLAEEYGDCLWYIAEGLNALGLDMGKVMEANIAKLRIRYPEKYSDLLAAEENRKREEEAKAVAAAKPCVVCGGNKDLWPHCKYCKVV